MTKKSPIKLFNILRSNHWLSVEMTLLNLYPNQLQNIEAYRLVFEKLQQQIVEENEITLVIKELFDNETEESTSPDIYGTTLNEEFGLALEFTEWSKWLGMSISEQTLKVFNELEIISHCLYEMTFIAFDEAEIKKQSSKISEIADEYKKLTDEEKKLRTISLDDLLREIDNMI